MSDNPFASAQPPERENPFAVALQQALKATTLEGRPGSVEGLYVVHFGDMASPDHLFNGGVVVLETGRVFGGDSGYFYTGSYTLNGQTLEGKVTVQRHNPKWVSVWDDQATKFDIEFAGQRRYGGSVIEGTMRRLDLPNASLPVKWLRMTDLP